MKNVRYEECMLVLNEMYAEMRKREAFSAFVWKLMRHVIGVNRLDET